MRIITISDIHFKKSFEKETLKPVMNSFFESFGKKIVDIHSEMGVDALVIGGDIAFSGDETEYKAVAKVLRGCIPKEIPIFCVPGNHDVNWTYLEKALEGAKLSTLFNRTEQDISKDLEKEESSFAKIFQPLKVNFIDDINNQIDDLEGYNFCDKHHAGYYFSKENEILLLLLNSSWFSFGPGVVESFYDKEFELVKDAKTIKELFKSFLHGSLKQEGKQSYFLKSFPFYDEVIEIITENEDVRVVTFAHHPTSWLNWDEQFSDADPDARNLNDLLDITHLLITGHIHNPVQAPSKLNEKSYFLNNGAFLEYEYVENAENISPISKFPNSWFNMIDIETDAFKYTAYKLKCSAINKARNQYEFVWELKNSFDNKKRYFFRRLISDGNVYGNEKSNFTPYGIDGIQEDLPFKLDHFRDIVDNYRKNTVEYTQNLKINGEGVYDLRINNEHYVVLFNSLVKIFDLFQATDSDQFHLLHQDSQFKLVMNRLENAENEELPILAFYDFIRFKEEINEEDYQKYNKLKEIKYQAFKHIFFGKFKELHKFAELELVFDLFILD